MHVWVVEGKCPKRRRWIALDLYTTRVAARKGAIFHKVCMNDEFAYRIRKYVPAQKDGQA